MRTYDPHLERGYFLCRHDFAADLNDERQSASEHPEHRSMVTTYQNPPADVFLQVGFDKDRLIAAQA